MGEPYTITVNRKTFDVVFGMRPTWPTTLTHAHEVGRGNLKTLCGVTITWADWYEDAWADGPECKRCLGALAKLEALGQKGNDDDK